MQKRYKISMWGYCGTMRVESYKGSFIYYSTFMDKYKECCEEIKKWDYELTDMGFKPDFLVIQVSDGLRGSVTYSCLKQHAKRLKKWFSKDCKVEIIKIR